MYQSEQAISVRGPQQKHTQSYHKTHHSANLVGPDSWITKAFSCTYREQISSRRLPSSLPSVLRWVFNTRYQNSPTLPLTILVNWLREEHLNTNNLTKHIVKPVDYEDIGLISRQSSKGLGIQFGSWKEDSVRIAAEILEVSLYLVITVSLMRKSSWKFRECIMRV